MNLFLIKIIQIYSNPRLKSILFEKNKHLLETADFACTYQEALKDRSKCRRCCFVRKDANGSCHYPFHASMPRKDCWRQSKEHPPQEKTRHDLSRPFLSHRFPLSSLIMHIKYVISMTYIPHQLPLSIIILFPSSLINYS